MRENNIYLYIRASTDDLYYEQFDVARIYVSDPWFDCKLRYWISNFESCISYFNPVFWILYLEWPFWAFVFITLEFRAFLFRVMTRDSDLWLGFNSDILIFSQISVFLKKNLSHFFLTQLERKKTTSFTSIADLSEILNMNLS